MRSCPLPLRLRRQRAPSLTGARSPRLRRRRGASLTAPLPSALSGGGFWQLIIIEGIESPFPPQGEGKEFHNLLIAKRLQKTSPCKPSLRERVRVSAEVQRRVVPISSLLRTQHLVHLRAAVHYQGLPSHKVAVRRTRKHHRAYQVLRPLGALDGAGLEALLQAFLLRWTV